MTRKQTVLNSFVDDESLHGDGTPGNPVRVSPVLTLDTLNVTGQANINALVVASLAKALYLEIGLAPNLARIQAGTGSPDGAVLADRGSLYLRTDVAQLWQNTNGSLAWSQVGPTFSGVSVYSSLVVPTGPGAVTLMTYNQEQYKTAAGYHDNAVNNSRLIAPVAGYYSVRACIAFSPSASGGRDVQIRKNAAGSGIGGTQLAVVSSVANSAAGSFSIQEVSVVALLAAGDYVECFGTQSSAGALNANVGDNCPFQMSFVGS